VLDSAGNNEHLALAELDVAITSLDRELAMQHEEKLVGVVMHVPDECALNPDHGHRLVASR
jgi:hypothetical protein